MGRCQPSCLVVLALVGCGVGETGATASSEHPTLSNAQRLVFTPTCATALCHAAGAVVDLSSEAATFAALVDAPTSNPTARQLGWLRVTPGDPGRSFLMRKLDGPGLGEGNPMPSAIEQLDGSAHELLVQWITLGARP
jgi:hypothetical protein